MDHLDELESRSIYIIREAYRQFKDIAALWSIGKDSTTLVWLIRKAFYGKVPFPVVHIDTSYKFKEIYAFREKWAKERYFSPRNREFQWNYKDQPPELWDQYKTKQEGEEHIRVHPLLHWTELDIWNYIKREGIPVVELYFAKGGRRYRSIGCEPCCSPIPSDADTIDKIVEELKTTKISERSGRAQDKERAYMMQKLRALGYM